ncbi:hypothetical protein AUJ14_00100 [Candidatus Micrarchaeota archaeon CG1_02_55_22]|nr:MAG: hypothetical protein AUJ14_00100 [Candidatus Micrarchaeota archaeon CG1_02_55_22]
MDEEFSKVASEFKEFSEKMRDPLVVGTMLNKLSEERSSTNLLLKDIQAKLESMETKIARIEERLSQAPETEKNVSDVDEKLLGFVRANERVCAQQVQGEFGYKNRNAASSRLNALWKQGILQKTHKGKTVYFTVIG